MRKRIDFPAIAGTVALCLSLTGCRNQSQPWVPVLEETSTVALKAEAEAAIAEVEAAQKALVTAPDEAAFSLEKAHLSLGRLLDYYLPVLEARERAYNAYRHYALGERHLTLKELDQVERILVGVAQGDHGHLLREMEDPLEEIEVARVALEANPDEARQALESLARRVNFLLLKAEMVID